MAKQEMKQEIKQEVCNENKENKKWLPGQKHFNDRKEFIRLPNTNEEGYRDKTKDSDSTQNKGTIRLVN